jgi:hypothetical protein
MRTGGTFLGALTLSLLGGVANAQPSTSIAVDPPPPVENGPELGSPETRRFFGGFSLGRGSIEIACPGCDGVAPITEGLSYSGHVGWMVLPRVAVLLEHWSISYNDRGTEWFDDSAEHLIAQRMTTIDGQVWIGSRLWLRGGVGVGKHVSDSRYAKPWLYDDGGNLRARTGAPIDEPDHAGDWTPAVTGAIGYEWARNQRLALDVQLRAGATRRPADEYQVYDTAIVFGASWF